jgi:hypothetical protein
MTGIDGFFGLNPRSGSNASIAARTPNLNLSFGSGNGGTSNLNVASGSVRFRFEPIF